MTMHRSPGEGNIFQKNGRWYGVLMDGYTEAGKRNLIRFHSKSKKELLDQIARYRADRAKYFSPDSKTPFTIWADRWFASITPDLQESTLPGYRSTLKLLEAEFDMCPVGEIKTINVNDYLTRMQEAGYSYTAVSKLKIMLGQIFEAAIDNEMIFINPARRAKKVIKARFETTQHRVNKKDSWTDDEFFTLLSNLPDDRLGNSVRLMMITGIRTQEVLALDLDHIAEDGSCIYIEHAVKLGKDGPYLGSPKSTASKRRVAIPGDFWEFVSNMRSLCMPNLWEGKNGKPYSPAAFCYHYKNMMDQFPTVRTLTPHCCRHTYVSRLLANDVPVDLITANTGHASRINAQPYMHVGMETKQKAANNLCNHIT